MCLREKGKIFCKVWSYWEIEDITGSKWVTKCIQKSINLYFHLGGSISQNFTLSFPETIVDRIFLVLRLHWIQHSEVLITYTWRQKPFINQYMNKRCPIGCMHISSKQENKLTCALFCYIFFSMRSVSGKAVSVCVAT